MTCEDCVSYEFISDPDFEYGSYCYLQDDCLSSLEICRDFEYKLKETDHDTK